MRTLLIVDDEKGIRNGVRAMIDWANTSFKNIFECSDGAEALEWLKSNNTDLMLIDIRMPNMDGIELLKKVSEFSIPPKSIILSGYGEFSYASESIKYGASAYLLKPVHREELREVLRKIEKDLDSRDEYFNKINKAEHINNEIIYKQIIEVFKGQIDKYELEKLEKNRHLEMFKTGFKICVCKIPNGDLKEEQILTFRKEINSSSGIDTQLWITEDEVIVVCDFEDDFIKWANSYQNLFIWGVSSDFVGIENINKAYNQARKLLRYGFYYPELKVLSQEVIMDIDKSKFVPIRNIKQIANLIFTDKIEQLNTIFEKAFNPKDFVKRDISCLEETINVINNELFNKFLCSEYANLTSNTSLLYDKSKLQDSDIIINTSIKSKVEILKDFNNFRCIDDYFFELKNFIEEINFYLLYDSDTQKRINDVKTAITYIKDNFNKDINMAMISNKVNISYNYFSREFKRITGAKFIDYLREYRINKSKELLETTTFKISKISEAVGYKNEKNFATAFRQLCGISPSEYRSNLNLHKKTSNITNREQKIKPK